MGLVDFLFYYGVIFPDLYRKDSSKTEYLQDILSLPSESLPSSIVDCQIIDQVCYNF